MTRMRFLRGLPVLALVAALLVPMAASATGPVTPPIAFTGPRILPIPMPTSDLLVNAPLTANALEAEAWDGGRRQESQGRGIRQTLTGLGAGLTLYDTPHVCANFNADIGWSASDGNPSIYTDWYSGWGPFALNEGEYQSGNVVFSRERVVGPGNRFNDNNDTDGHEENSIKIAGHRPYAAGLGSPRIAVPAGFEGGKVLVSVKYLIWDHDQAAKVGYGDGIDTDWASLGIKPGADGDVALYANGYVRGEWAELTNMIELGDAQDVMVLVQAQSPGFLNSNIYFDDIKIAFISPTGTVRYLQDCSAEESIR